jgi:hypothetical protein
MCPRQGEPDLAIDPVYNARGAEVDGEGGGPLFDGPLELLLPAAAGFEALLVEPDLELRRTGLGFGLDPLCKSLGRLLVGAGMTEEKERVALGERG